MSSVSIVSLRTSSLTRVPSSSPRCGGISARNWEPLSAYPLATIHNLMARWSVPTRAWRRPFAVLLIVVQPPGPPTFHGWNMHTTPWFLPSLACLPGLSTSALPHPGIQHGRPISAASPPSSPPSLAGGLCSTVASEAKCCNFLVVFGQSE